MIGLTNHIEAKRKREYQKRSEDSMVKTYYPGLQESVDDIILKDLTSWAGKTDDFSTVSTLGNDMEVYNK